MIGHLSERQLEDFICRYPDAYGEADPSPGHRKIIGRQVDVEHGRIDLLVWHDWWDWACNIEVVELKAGTLTADATGQVWRYTRDVRHVMDSHFHTFNPFDMYDMGQEGQAWQYLTEAISTLGNPDNIIHPVLIGTDITSDAAAICEATQISVYLWKHNRDDNTISFTHLPGRKALRPLPDAPAPKWTEELYDLVLQKAMKAGAERMRFQETNDLKDALRAHIQELTVHQPEQN